MLDQFANERNEMWTAYSKYSFIRLFIIPLLTDFTAKEVEDFVLLVTGCDILNPLLYNVFLYMMLNKTGCYQMFYTGNAWYKVCSSVADPS